MARIALLMLIGDTTKYAGMVFGVAFSVLLICQQGGIFVGLVERASTAIRDARDVDLWIMDPRVPSVDNPRALPETALYRVRGVEGVAWTAPLLKTTTQLVTDKGRLETATLFGLDDVTLRGLPPGAADSVTAALRAPGAVVMDEAGWRFLFGTRPFVPGTELELNDQRAVVVALLPAGALFTSQVSLFTRYSEAIRFSPGGRKRLSFVLAGLAPGADPAVVATRVSDQTGLKALRSPAFADATRDYVIGNTGIPASFGAVVGLGIVVGVVVVALTFALFIRDNLRELGALKAIGVSNATLLGMVSLQGIVIGLLGYGIGLGLAAAFFEGAGRNSLALRGFFLPWPVAAFAAAVVVIIVVIAGAIGVRRVLAADPAEVFRA